MILAANWKMHGSSEHLVSYCEALLPRCESLPHQIVLCPPYPLLPQAVMLCAGSQVQVGAQNCHWHQQGAFTGEVSPWLLVQLGVGWVVVGHSERRQHFGETDGTAAARAKAAQEAGLRVIFCVGETLEERQRGETFEVLQRQLHPLEVLAPTAVVVAYEPVWAIGTGHNASPEQIQQAHQFIQAYMREQGKGEVAVIYGGSVKPENAAEILHTPGVAGALVGGASLDATAFWAIIQAAPQQGGEG
ncbi:MAG: triose-phosphate isomerase [Thermoanaerobaculum sp.]|nr:triose-phosphate isomerase [Thermoanaerobaculum sp.]MDW7967939.1 triose-phosphate isomerase [Thermoanaerobaculum sp.]